jgi:transposase
MISARPNTALQVFLACGATDIRNSIDGLAAIVTQQFNLDPFSNSMFVFCNRQKDKIKILQWEPTGFTLWYKRLEKGKFQWPANSSEPISISERQLRWMLDGLSLVQPKAHHEVNARVMF